MTRRPPARIVFAGAVILLLAFGLRAHRLAYDSVWWDEGYSIWMGRMSLPDMLYQTARDAHPPLSYALLHGWIGLAGEEEFALRLQSALFGMLTVALAGRIGALAGGRRAALASALLAAVMRLPVWWSQEVRMYAPAMLLAALSLWAALRLFTARGRLWPPALLLALSLGAGLLTLYLFAGVALALNLAFAAAFVLSARRWRLAGAWIAAQAGALALAAPWAAYALPTLPSWETPQAGVTFGHVVRLYLSTVFLGIATDIERYLPLLAAAVIALIGAAAFALAGRRGRRAGSIWAALVIASLLPPLLVYLLSLPRGAFNYPTPSPRYFVILSTPVYVLLGWGLTARGRAAIPRLAALAALLAAAGWSLADYYPGLHLADDYPSMAAALEALRQPGDAVILNNDTDWPIFNYHYRGDYSRHITQTRRVWDEKYAGDLLRPYRESNAGVWLVQTRYAAVTDPDNHLGEWLAARAWNQMRYTFPEGELWFFAMQPERGQPSTMARAGRWPDAFQPLPDVPIAEGVTLAGFTQPVPEVRAGETLVIGLGYEVGRRVQGEWPVAISVIGADGAAIARAGAALPGQGRERRFVPVEVFIPPDAPGGRAQIVFTAGENWAALGSVRLRPRPPGPPSRTAIPTDAEPLGIRFGDGITLRAIDRPDRATWAPGESIPLTLYWEAEAIIPDSYKVFVHVVGEAYDPTDDSNIWGQQDQEPRGGAAPTTAWRPGEVIADDYRVPIQPDAPPGRYAVRIGLYRPLGGQRLTAAAPDGSALGDAVTVLEITIAAP